MTDIYRMIDELHAIVTSPEFFRLRHQHVYELLPGLYVGYDFGEDSATFTFTNLTVNDIYYPQPNDLVEISTYGEPPRLYKICEGSTADNWLVTPNG